VEDYNTPHGRFTGTIGWVRMEIGTDVHEDHEPRRALLDLEKAGLAAGARWKNSGPSPQDRLMALRSKPSGLKSAADQSEHALWVGFVELNEPSQSQLLTFAVI
jgi:hypothetical protein